MLIGMSEQIAVRLADGQVAFLDELVAAGRFASRAEAVRSAIDALADAERRRSIGAEIVAGYTRTPQTDEELAGAEAAALASIAEEPW